MDPVWGSPAQPGHYHDQLEHIACIKSQNLQQDESSGGTTLLHQDVLSIAAEEPTAVNQEFTSGKRVVVQNVSANDEVEHQDQCGPSESTSSNIQSTPTVPEENSHQNSEPTLLQTISCTGEISMPARVSTEQGTSERVPSDDEEKEEEDIGSQLRCNSSLTDDSIEHMPLSEQSELRPDTPDIESAEALFSMPGAMATSTPKPDPHKPKPDPLKPDPLKLTSPVKLLMPASVDQQCRHTQVPTVVASAVVSPTRSPDTTTVYATAKQALMSQHAGYYNPPVSIGTDLMMPRFQMASQPLPMQQNAYVQNVPGTAMCIDGQGTVQELAPSTSVEPAKKARRPSGQRQTYTPRMQETMEKFYDYNPYPNRQEKTMLSDMLGLPVDRVTVWFQNKRNKDRKKRKAEGTLTSQLGPGKRICPANSMSKPREGPDSGLPYMWNQIPQGLGHRMAAPVRAGIPSQYMYPAAPDARAAISTRLRWPHLAQQLASRAPPSAYSVGPRMPIPSSLSSATRVSLRGADAQTSYGQYSRLPWPESQSRHLLAGLPVPRLGQKFNQLGCNRAQSVFPPVRGTNYSMYASKEGLQQQNPSPPPSVVVNSAGFVQLAPVLPCTPLYTNVHPGPAIPTWNYGQCAPLGAKDTVRAQAGAHTPDAPCPPFDVGSDVSCINAQVGMDQGAGTHTDDMMQQSTHMINQTADTNSYIDAKPCDKQGFLRAQHTPEEACPQSNTSCSTENNLQIDLASPLPESGTEETDPEGTPQRPPGQQSKPVWRPVDVGTGRPHVTSHQLSDISSQSDVELDVPHQESTNTWQQGVPCKLNNPPYVQTSSQLRNLDHYTQWYTNQVQHYKTLCEPNVKPSPTVPLQSFNKMHGQFSGSGSFQTQGPDARDYEDDFYTSATFTELNGADNTRKYGLPQSTAPWQPYDCTEQTWPTKMPYASTPWQPATSSSYTLQQVPSHNQADIGAQMATNHCTPTSWAGPSQVLPCNTTNTPTCAQGYSDIGVHGVPSDNCNPSSGQIPSIHSTDMNNNDVKGEHPGIWAPSNKDSSQCTSSSFTSSSVDESTSRSLADKEDDVEPTENKEGCWSAGRWSERRPASNEVGTGMMPAGQGWNHQSAANTATHPSAYGSGGGNNTYQQGNYITISPLSPPGLNQQGVTLRSQEMYPGPWNADEQSCVSGRAGTDRAQRLTTIMGGHPPNPAGPGQDSRDNYVQDAAGTQCGLQL